MNSAGSPTAASQTPLIQRTPHSRTASAGLRTAARLVPNGATGCSREWSSAQPRIGEYHVSIRTATFHQNRDRQGADVASGVLAGRPSEPRPFIRTATCLPFTLRSDVKGQGADIVIARPPPAGVAIPSVASWLRAFVASSLRAFPLSLRACRRRPWQSLASRPRLANFNGQTIKP
jgi:hypothetical protein